EPEPEPRVTANGLYGVGINGIVVQGASPAASVASTIEEESGLHVQALWLLMRGQWLYFLPASEDIEGGLAEFPDAPVAAFAILT
ncbi:MAG TPA: hypothetical protein VNL92_02855, partial [Dehalococcoidia bacterium]|nr:hypothetical protein [Dehalococcoidia bacterium]